MEWEDEAELAFDELLMKHIRREGLTSGKARVLETAMMRAIEEHARARESSRVNVSDVKEVLGPDTSSSASSEPCIESGVGISCRAIPADLILLFMLRSLRGEEDRSGEVHLSHLL